MALQQLTDDGYLTWTCTHCGKQQTVHHSHEEVQWGEVLLGMDIKHAHVWLPVCACKHQTRLKVHFTEAELQAPNMWLPWTGEHEASLQQCYALHTRFQDGTLTDEERAELVEAQITPEGVTEQIARMEQVKAAGGQHTESHAVAQRHMDLARQLVASGKLPPGHPG